MKTKNVILGIAALVFAGGGAFASMSNPPVEILVKPVNEDFQCKVIQRQCNNVQPSLCKVRVQTTSGLKLATVWQFESACVIPLFDNRPFVGNIVVPSEVNEGAIEAVQ